MTFIVLTCFSFGYIIYIAYGMYDAVIKWDRDFSIKILISSTIGIVFACVLWYGCVWAGYTAIPEPPVLKGTYRLVVDNELIPTVTFLETGEAVITQEGIAQIVDVVIDCREDEEGSLVIDTITFKGDETMVFTVEEQTKWHRELSGTLKEGDNEPVQAFLVK